MISASVAKTMDTARAVLARPRKIDPDKPIKVGVDLGTAFSVIIVTDEKGKPLGAVNQFADVVRDGIVWDFAGAVEVIRDLKKRLEAKTGRALTSGAVTVPPAQGEADHRAHHYVLEGAGIACAAVIDETTAANAVLGITDGAVVDIGGGTTGVAIIRGGKVVKNIDEPSGGTHLSLVISGALKMPFAEAEKIKVDPRNHDRLLPIVRPTLEKLATIVRNAVEGEHVKEIHLVGGTSDFTGIADIMTDITGVPSVVAPQPMLVTPLGVAQWATPITGSAQSDQGGQWYGR